MREGQGAEDSGSCGVPKGKEILGLMEGNKRLWVPEGSRKPRLFASLTCLAGARVSWPPAAPTTSAGVREDQALGKLWRAQIVAPQLGARPQILLSGLPVHPEQL